MFRSVTKPNIFIIYECIYLRFYDILYKIYVIFYMKMHE